MRLLNAVSDPIQADSFSGQLPLKVVKFDPRLKPPEFSDQEVRHNINFPHCQPMNLKAQFDALPALAPLKERELHQSEVATHSPLAHVVNIALPEFRFPGVRLRVQSEALDGPRLQDLGTEPEGAHPSFSRFLIRKCISAA